MTSAATVILQLLIGLVVSSLFLSPLAHGAEVNPSWQAEWNRTVEAAKKEGHLVLYSGTGYPEIFAEFQKKYPEIKVVTGSPSRPPELAQRLMTERRGGKNLVDLFIDGSSTIYYVLYKGKVLDPIKPALILPEVLDESKWWKGKHSYQDPEGNYIFAFNGELQSYFCYNTTLVNPDEIRSYWDLLNPKWKGKIVVLDPTQSGAGSATTLRFLYHNSSLGPQFIRRFLGEMDLTASRDTRQITDWLAVGKFALSAFVSASRAGVVQAKKQGLPVDWFGPKTFKEGAVLSASNGNIALVNGAPHPNAAKVAMNWLLSREGQILYQKIYGEPDSLRVDIPKDQVASYSRRVEGVKYFDVDQPELMDREPIVQIVNEVWKKGK
jgi:ABC-type Fe3+ transport system substrate-binding protein